MKVIFTQNIKGIAQMGDIKNVTDGYARNFLLPRKLAKAADAASQKLAETLRFKREATAQLTKDRATKMVGDLEGLVLEASEEANEEGHLYGSISVDNISELLKKNKKNIAPDEINLPEPIKAVGEYDIELELHPEVKTAIKLKVVAK